MKKLISIIITLALLASLTLSASAITIGKWNLSAGKAHAEKVAEEIIAEEQANSPTWNRIVFDWFRWPWA